MRRKQHIEKFLTLFSVIIKTSYSSKTHIRVYGEKTHENCVHLKICSGMSVNTFQVTLLCSHGIFVVY